METEYEKPLVLVVDDDPTNLRILVSKLNREYRLGVAKSGTKALEYMGKQIPDLVLLDVMMPDMDGYAVCEHIKRDPRLCDIPVVFISYVDDPSQKTRGFEVGGVDYITKPFHDAEVLARVRTHIMNKQMREQLKRHNAEIGKELDEHRRQLLALLDNLPGLAYRETVIGGIPDARRAVSFVSDGVLGLTGYAPDRFMGEERLGLTSPTKGTAKPSAAPSCGPQRHRPGARLPHHHSVGEENGGAVLARSTPRHAHYH
ncbi:MAG: two-component system response regulator [Bilophila wadsworthia]